MLILAALLVLLLIAVFGLTHTAWLHVAWHPVNYWKKKRQFTIVRRDGCQPFICATWSPLLVHVYLGFFQRGPIGILKSVVIALRYQSFKMRRIREMKRGGIRGNHAV